jgi:hypothetical protein
MAAAEGRGKPLTKADYQAFDARIRQEPANEAATRARRASCGMRWCWLEILGPPVSLRGEAEEH